LAAAFAAQDRGRLFDADGRAVRSLGGQGVEGVGDGGDPAAGRDARSSQATRVAAAVEAFVVRPGQLGRRVERLVVRACQQRVPDGRMLLQRPPGRRRSAPPRAA